MTSITMTSITYMKFSEDSISPYRVLGFVWDPKTHETVCNVSLDKYYINSDTDAIVEIYMEKQDRDPNKNYYIPKNRFSINVYGYTPMGIYIPQHIFPHDKRNGRDTRRDPHQWEFDRQAQEDDLGHETKSINTQVWTEVDKYIRWETRERERERERNQTTCYKIPYDKDGFLYAKSK